MAKSGRLEVRDERGVNPLDSSLVVREEKAGV